MGRMVEGKWTTEWYEPDEEGRFQRPETTFRSGVGEGTDFPVEPDRYHLYVAYACPWAHRTLMMRKLKGLEEVLPISVVHPHMGDDGWVFADDEPGCIPDTVLGKDYLREVYAEADPHFTGRVTVPVLWDKKQDTIVNNESAEVMRILDTEFDEFADNQVTLYPNGYREVIDETIEAIYEPINNGVYRAGFATTQKAYEEAVEELFRALNQWETVLGSQRYVCGDVFTEADICMFTTLFRFDLVYHYHFRCNVRRIRDYPNLWNFVKEVHQMPGVAETTNVDHTKRHYFGSHPTINPEGIVPVGPAIDFTAPHDRDRLPGEVRAL